LALERAYIPASYQLPKEWTQQSELLK